ncbi:MAG: GTPase ObgE [Proteobacteria bacterium]|nr:GTPase ObgE [Pseudomonadota bacterium]
MRFIDEVTIRVEAGDGGDGCAAMRREKYRPLGGPCGGDGGQGGHIVLEADVRLGTLVDLRYRRLLRAERGAHGRGKDQHGRAGKSLTARVPVGTLVFDADTGELLEDLAAPAAHFVAARGGRGGRGNMHFAAPQLRAPTFAEPGARGEQRSLRLELKLIADVGIVGFPNAGKSTLIRAVSRAQPKVADYPFTTLVPKLGVVSLSDERSFVLADIPGIIEGASEGAGLGLRFLRHIERTRVLLFLACPEYGAPPVQDQFAALERELRQFDSALSSRPALYAVSKLDLPEARAAFEATRQREFEAGRVVHGVSAISREGVTSLLEGLWDKLQQAA